MNFIDIDGITVVSGNELILTDEQSALNLIGNVSYQTGGSKIVIHINNISEDFFKLSTGLLGGILQKFVNYGIKLAIVGDFSKYKSKPLHDFIYESNRGGHIFFMVDEQSAIQKLKD